MSPSSAVPARRDAHGSGSVRNRRLLAGAATAAVLATSAWAPMAFATHYQASLDGNDLQDPSLFEIDDDANLTLDDPQSPTGEDDVVMLYDWGNVDQTYNLDKINGTGDDSYAGGVKEDTVCPATTTDSIPPNKSDLLQFGAWEEEGSPGYLHLYWVRVTEPTGTTLMDFEFNQSELDCAGSPNKQRTVGDLLIEYSIDQGGARANMTLREWNGTRWGAAVDVDGAAMAAGTINSSPIDQQDTLTQDQSARTFGEASIDLNLVFDDASCESFGSAMLKSRSSDSFTSQLKDFVAPIPLTLTNCGKVEITKQTTPDGDTTLFDYTKTFSTDPVTGNTFSLADGETETFDNVLFGTQYTVTEDDLPAGWTFSDVDCSASTGDVSYTEDQGNRKVTFDIQDANDYLKCTFNNEALADLTIVKQVTDDPGTDDFDFTTSGGLVPSTFTLAPTGTAEGEEDTQSYPGISTGTYSVAETVPAGWNLTSATCDNGDPVTAIELGAGDDVTCTFVNERERGAIDITKLRKHAGADGGEAPHAGVTFTVTSADFPDVDVDVVTAADGTACVDDLLYGDYTVTETVPANYVSADDSKDVTVSAEADCTEENRGAAADVGFMNTPLTDVTVSVDSLVDEGTASTISCVDGAGTLVDEDTTNAPGDVSLTVEDLEPTAPTATLVCTIVVDP